MINEGKVTKNTVDNEFSRMFKENLNVVIFETFVRYLETKSKNVPQILVFESWSFCFVGCCKYSWNLIVISIQNGNNIGLSETPDASSYINLPSLLFLYCLISRASEKACRILPWLESSKVLYIVNFLKTLENFTGSSQLLLDVQARITFKKVKNQLNALNRT